MLTYLCLSLSFNIFCVYLGCLYPSFFFSKYVRTIDEHLRPILENYLIISPLIYEIDSSDFEFEPVQCQFREYRNENKNGRLRSHQNRSGWNEQSCPGSILVARHFHNQRTRSKCSVNLNLSQF